MAVEYGDRYSIEQEILKEQATKERNAITDAVNLAGTKGAGMMYHAVGEGQRQGAGLEGLGRMLTGQEKPIDPRLARQDALKAILDPHGTPDSYEDMVAIANDLRVGGFPGEADLAMTQANEYKKMETDRMNATSSATTANTKAQKTEDRDFIKLVNGKRVVYTKRVGWDNSTKSWVDIPGTSVPKWSPDSKTALTKDLLLAAEGFPNMDGSKGCDLEDDACYIYATKKVRDAKGTQSEFEKGMGKVMSAELMEEWTGSKDAFKTIGIINSSFRNLNSAKPITGWAAQPRLTFAKAIGVLTGKENERINATELWLASTAGLVTEIMGSGDLGAGTGLSDNDIKFAKAMVAGDIDLDENSVRRILWMRRILEVEKIKRWHETYGELHKDLKDDMTYMGLSKRKALTDIPTWDENMIFLRPPEGHIKLNDSAGTVYYYWPANPKYDVTTINYKGKFYTVHDKNGFDVTPTQQGN
jgi:hypothetical protein